MNKTVFAAALLAASGLAGASLANADVISIGVSINGGAIATLASGTDSASFVYNSSSYGVSISGLGSPPLTGGSLLDSNNLDFASIALTGTYNIFVSESGITSYTGLEDFISSFTENSLTAGWTVTETTYLSPTDTVYGKTTTLGTAPFTNIGTNIQSLTANTDSGPYSVTTEYSISPNGISGSDNSTIDVSVPEPGTIALFGAGLLGCAIALGRWRRRPRA